MSDGFIPVLHGASLGRPDERDTLIAAEAIQNALRRLGFASDLVHVGLDLGALGSLAERRPQLVFNLVEAIDGNGALAPVAALALDHFGLSYTGCPRAAMLDTLSKMGSKRRLQLAGLPTPAWSSDGRGFSPDATVIVKSDTEHASIGLDATSIVPAERAADEIAARQKRFGGRFFAEVFVDGREFNLSVLDAEGRPEVLPVAEIDFIGYCDGMPRIVDYAAKWDAGTYGFSHTPRRFDVDSADAPLVKHLRLLAESAWKVFDLAGYARVDFRVDVAGEASILEVNTNPCLSPDAGFVAAAERAGLHFDDVIARIVDAAARRCAAS